MLRLTARDREIWRLALPAFAALIAEPLYLLADTAVVGRLGVDQLGGLAVASQILIISLAVFIFLAYGTTGAVSRLLGAGRPRQAAHQAIQALWLALGVGVIFGAATFIAARPLVRLLGGEESTRVLDFAEIYLRISAFGLPAMLLALAGVGYLRGLQDTVRPLIVAVVTALGNFVLEVILVWGLDYGIGASALSTVIFQWIGAGMYLWWIARAVREHDVGLRPDLRVLSELAVAGLDLFLRTAALRGSLTTAVFVAARLGPVQLAAHEIAFQFWSIAAFGLDAVAIAGQAMVGKFLGADDPEEARAVGWRITQWGIVLGLAAGALILAMAPWAGHIFSTDEAVIGATSTLLVITAISQPVNGVAFALDGVLIGAGDLRWLAIMMTAAAVVFVPLALSVLWFDGTINHLWGALLVFMAVRAATLLARFRSSGWTVTGA